MSLLPVTFFKKLMHKKTFLFRSNESNNCRPCSEYGRTMLEVLMALLILGLISVGGYAGVRYGLGLSQAWRGQAQINQLAKDIMALYAWQDSYATLSMRGSRGICNTIITPGNQDCVITSPWNQSITVSTGNSNASFKIVLHDTPKSICEHLLEMRFDNVYMAQSSCSSGTQDIEFLMDKNDRECPDECPSGYDCVNGECRAQGREDSCENVSCDGECLTGVCRGGTCLRKLNGTACSIGVCKNGTCVVETTETDEESTTIEETTTETTTTTQEVTTLEYSTTSITGESCSANSDCGSGNYCGGSNESCYYSNYNVCKPLNYTYDIVTYNKQDEAWFELSENMSWWDAVNACSAAGARLPTVDELTARYSVLFSRSGEVWTSDLDSTNCGAYYFSMSDGTTGIGQRSNSTLTLCFVPNE